MQNMKIVSAALLAALAIPIIGRADAFNPKQVPADAKWVLHADLDAARDTKSFDTVCDKIFSDEKARAKLDQIEQISGMKIPEDLNDVTLYGKTADDNAGVVLVHGKIDQQQTLTSLKFAQQYGSTPYGNYQVLTWFDKEKGQTMFGAFHDDSHLMLGHTQKNIETALDVMDGKAEAIKADSPLLGGAKPQLLIYIAARDVSELHGKDAKPNPIASSVDSAWISISEKDDMVNLRAQLQGSSAESATDIRQSLDGLKGMLSLSSRGDNPDPVAKAVVAAAKSFSTTQNDKTVTIDWPMPVEQVQTIINAAVAKHGQN